MFNSSNQPTEIGVFAYYDYDDIFLNNARAIGSGSYWTFDPAIAWSTPFLNIITYAPYADGTHGLDVLTSEQELIEIRYKTPVEAAFQPDFIYSANTEYTQKSLMKLSYTHLLSAVSFTIKSADLDLDYYNAKIHLKHIYSGALLSISYKKNLSWSDYYFDDDTAFSLDVSSLTSLDDKGNSTLQSDGYFMLLPQILTGNALAQLTLTNKETLEESIYYFRFTEFEEWEAGCSYNYPMNI